MKDSFAFIFPGQGAQYPLMGMDFYQTFSQAKSVIDEADRILGRKLSDLIFSDAPNTKEELALTQNSQCAIFVLSAAILAVLKEHFPALQPTFCAGLSLGEYSALFASGRLDFESSLLLVNARATFMSDACRKNPGSMAVVMGMKEDHVLQAVQDFLGENNLSEGLCAANFNAPGQVVLSGRKDLLELAKPYFLQKGAKRFVPLDVEGAFHSSLMEPAKQRLEKKIRSTSFQTSSIKMVMNASARQEPEERIQDLLIEQLDHPVYWEKSVHAMHAAGVRKFLEIGCGKSLRSMAKRMNLDAEFINVEKIEDLEALEKLFAKGVGV